MKHKQIKNTIIWRLINSNEQATFNIFWVQSKFFREGRDSGQYILFGTQSFITTVSNSLALQLRVYTLIEL